MRSTLGRIGRTVTFSSWWPRHRIGPLARRSRRALKPAETTPTGRNVALFLAIVVVVTGVAGVMLRVLGPAHVGPDNSPGSAATGRLKPAPQAVPSTTPAQPQPPQAATESNYPRPRRPIARRPISFRGRRPRITRSHPHPRCQNRAWMVQLNRPRPPGRRPTRLGLIP